MIIESIVYFWIFLTSAFANSTDANQGIIVKYETAKPLIDYVDQDTYKNFVREGITTFIFFGADWCSHCKQFTPVWLDFQNAAKENHWNQYFEVKKVECTTNENLCKDINGYPTVHLYEDGIMTMDIDDRTLAPLLEKGKMVYEKLKGKGEGVFSSLKRLLDQDSSSVRNSQQSQGRNVELTDDTFSLLTSGGLWFLKFYAPWCGHCKHLAPIWEELGRKMKDGVNIGSVDCTVHKDTCKKFQIKGYPSIIFINGDYKENYFGPRTLDALKDFALKQIYSPPFKIVEASEISKLYEEHPAFLIFAYNGLAHESIVTPMVSIMHSISKSIKGKIPVYFCPEKKGIENVQVKDDLFALVISRDNGLDQLVYNASLTSQDDIKKWILDNKDPLVPELTESNQSELSRSRILLIAIIDPDNSKDKSVLQDVVASVQSIRQKMKNFDDVKFTWLNGVKFSAYVNSVYGLDPSSFPRFVVTSPKDELFFKDHADGTPYRFTESSIVSAVNDAKEEKGTYYSTKGFLGLIILKTSRNIRWIWRTITGSLLSMILTIGIFGYLIYYTCFEADEGYSKLAENGNKFD